MSAATAFSEAPPRLLDLIFQRGDFALGKVKAKPAAAKAAASPGGTAPRSPQFSQDPGDQAVRRYAQVALDRIRNDIASCPPGGRNNELNGAAYGIAPFVTLGALSEREVFAALQDGFDAWGLSGDASEVQKFNEVTRRGYNAGLGNTAAMAAKFAEIRQQTDQWRASRATPHSYSSSPQTPEPPDPDYAPDAPAGPAPPVEKEAGGARAASGEQGGGDIGGGQGGDRIDPDLLRRLSREPVNDTGNARRLIGHFGHDMLNVREVGEHRWAGTHWERVGGDHAFERFAQRTAELIALEGPFLLPGKSDIETLEAARNLKGSPPDKLTAEETAILAMAAKIEDRLDKRRGDRRKYSESCGNRTRTEAMIKQARPHITVEPEVLDADPLAINVMNGTLRLVKEVVEEEDPECPDPDARRTVKVNRWRVRLDPHDRKDRQSKVMPVRYDPAAECPKWLAFMRRFQPEYGIASFLQRFHGYALTGLTGEQVFLFNYGLGANGKSTFMEALARLQGAYAQVLPPEALTGESQRRSDQATPEFARLPGARLVRCAELPRGESFREATLKMLTGGEPMLVRHLNQGFFEMRPTFKAIGSGNDKPSIKGVDEGIWRRVKLVKWDVTISVAERRPMNTILAEFEQEASGILNWLLEGLLDYLDRGLQVPSEVSQATESYREDMDPIGEFIGAHVVKQLGETVGARTLYKAYVAWCHINSVKPFAEFTFSKIMEQKGFHKQKGRLRMYHDIRLEAPPVDPDAPPQGNFANSGWKDDPKHYE